MEYQPKSMMMIIITVIVIVIVMMNSEKKKGEKGVYVCGGGAVHKPEFMAGIKVKSSRS